jgi:hypothetical protein
MTKTSAHRKFKLYKALSKLKPDVLSEVLEHLNDNSIDDVCECVFNVIKTDLKLPANTKRKLRKKLQQKCSKRNLSLIMSKKVAVSKRKKALSQEGAGIGLILGTVIPLLANLLFNRKK